MYEDNTGCIIFFVATVVIALVTFLIAYPLPRYECSIKAEKQGLEYDFGLIQGCMVKIDGKWVDYDRFRIME